MHRPVYVSVLLFSVRGACLCFPPVQRLNVPQGGNATLVCNIPTRDHTAWYRQSRAELALLISASRGGLKHDTIIVSMNKDPDHFLLMTENMSLSITAVGPSDVGLYYCGRQDGVARMHFGKAIRLTLADVVDDALEATLLCWKLLLVASSLLAFTLICLTVICCKQGLCFNKKCVKENSSLKVMDLQYASLRHLPRARGRMLATAPTSSSTSASTSTSTSASTSSSTSTSTSTSSSMIYDTVAKNVTAIP